MNLIDRDYQNARLLKPNIRIPADNPPRPGIREKYRDFWEWVCTVICVAGFWFVVWLFVQAWRFLMKQGG